MEEIIVRDAIDLAQKASLQIFNLLFKIKREPIVLALSGGSTPKATYQYLSELLTENQFEKDLIILQVDERWVPASHDRANQRMISQVMDFSTKSISFYQWPLPPEAENPVVSAEQYTKLLSSLENKLDVVILGMGSDGHTASLFPYNKTYQKSLESPSYDCLTMFVHAQQEQRLSLSTKLLQEATYQILLISGEDKLKTLNQAHESQDQVKYPILSVIRDDTIVIRY